MGTLASNIFQQARMLVAQADREMTELAARFESSFPLSREEKEELRPCAVDAYDAWSIELAPRDGAATFLMTPQDDRTWLLSVARGEDIPVELGRFQAGWGANEVRGRLRAARVVSAIGNWLENRSAGCGAPVPSRLVSVEGKAYIEFTAQAHMPAQPGNGGGIQTSPKAPAAEPETIAAGRILEASTAGHPAQAAQPRWLDMLPGAQASEVEPAIPALLENRPQVAFRLGKIFGH
jgi:hypothetical protein